MTAGNPARILERAREALAGERDPACLLSPEGRYLFCNEAWDAFARRNGGDPGCLGERVVGRPWQEFVAGDEVRRVLARVLASALSGAPRLVQGECNSPTVGRRTASTYQAIRDGRGVPVGLAAVHAIVLEAPIAELHTVHEPDHGRYFEPSGLIHMCCCCRRVRRVAERGRWDFVPDYVACMPASTSHAYCPTCLELQFAAVRTGEPRR
jgi:hypothetical protein